MKKYLTIFATILLIGGIAFVGTQVFSTTDNGVEGCFFEDFSLDGSSLTVDDYYTLAENNQQQMLEENNITSSEDLKQFIEDEEGLRIGSDGVIEAETCVEKGSMGDN